MAQLFASKGLGHGDGVAVLAAKGRSHIRQLGRSIARHAYTPLHPKGRKPITSIS